MNWLSTAMIPMAVTSSFIHSHLPKSTNFELSRLMTLCVAEWQPHWGIIKGSWLLNQCAKLLVTSLLSSSPRENPPMPSQKKINVALTVFVLMFLQRLSWFIFLVIQTSVTQACKIFHNFPIVTDIIHLRNRSLL